jgi:hypothetical protein
MKISEKRRSLEEAFRYRAVNIDLYDWLFPFPIGIACNYGYLALIKAELARIETRRNDEAYLLRKAVVDLENCLKFCKTHVKAFPQPRLFHFIGEYQDWFGNILNRLYLLTEEKRHLKRAIRVYEKRRYSAEGKRSS